jgi:hypothetical protein
MKIIDEKFYDLIAQNDESAEHPYDVEWSNYDALQPTSTEVIDHE